ncbi:hypothetical protein [Fontibacter flavus]|uniref:CarboxypepD_reg-like domain-containing protein n=1 Tax=Fontibacter flavus TaxID=654838 RepID=A0ABV6FVM8_9BACT
MKTIYLAFLALLGINGSIHAQSTISGIVKDNTTKEGIEFVSIGVYSEKDSSLIAGNITDLEGEFRLENLPQGSFILPLAF